MSTAVESPFPVIECASPLSGIDSGSCSERSARLDVLRVSACLAVILLHLSATIVMDPEWLGTADWHLANLLDAATRWCVPVFVMLSGALLLDPQKHTNMQEFWTRRMNRLLPALVVWSMIYLLWRAYFWKEPLSMSVISHDLIVGRPYIHLYFLFLIAGLYLVTPFFAKAIDIFTPSQLRQAILIVATLAMAANLFDFLASSAFTMFVPYLAYYLGGWYCVRLHGDRPRPYGLAFAVAVLIITGLTAIFVAARGLNDDWSFYFYWDFSPAVMVSAFAVFMLAMRGAFSPRVKAVATRLAPWTLGVYIAHPLVVELLRYGYYHAVPILLRSPYYVPVTFALTCILTGTLVAVMQKVPGLRRIV
jgi:surface polysaccharide O-acyltransferase-like enzyme